MFGLQSLWDHRMNKYWIRVYVSDIVDFNQCVLISSTTGLSKCNWCSQAAYLLSLTLEQCLCSGQNGGEVVRVTYLW